MGWYKAMLGRAAEARDDCERAVALMREVGDGYGEAATLDSLAFVHHQLGDRHESVRYYRQAADLWQHLGDSHSVVSVLHRLGDILLANGEKAHAREAWRAAAVINEQIDHPEASELLRKLSRLRATTGS